MIQTRCITHATQDWGERGGGGVGPEDRSVHSEISLPHRLPVISPIRTLAPTLPTNRNLGALHKLSVYFLLVAEKYTTSRDLCLAERDQGHGRQNDREKTS